MTEISDIMSNIVKNSYENSRRKRSVELTKKRIAAILTDAEHKVLDDPQQKKLYDKTVSNWNKTIESKTAIKSKPFDILDYV